MTTRRIGFSLLPVALLLVLVPAAAWADIATQDGTPHLRDGVRTLVPDGNYSEALAAADSLRLLAFESEDIAASATAESLYTRILDALRGEERGSPELTRRALKGIVYTRLGQGEHLHALKPFRELERLTNEALGPDSDEVAHLRGDVGWYLWNEAHALCRRARYAEASVLADSVLVIRETDPRMPAFEVNTVKWFARTVRFAADLPEEQRRELACCDSVMSSIESNEDREAAAAEAERCLEIRRRILGDVHPDVIQSINVLVGYLWAQGEFDRVGELVEEALGIALAVHGEDHWITADRFSQLADIDMERQQFARAESLYLRAVGIRTRIFGRDNPNTLHQRATLAQFYLAMGDYAAAESQFREVMALQIGSMGEEHPHVARTMNELALLLQRQQRFEESDELYVRILEIWRNLYGDLSIELAVSTHGYAALRSTRGDFVTAERLYDRALAMYLELLGEDSLRIAEVGLERASLCRLLGRYDEARALCEMVIEREGDPGRAMPTDVAEAYAILGSINATFGDQVASDAMYRKSLEILRSVYGDDHVRMAWAHHTAASRLYLQGDLVGAEAFARDALAKKRAMYGDRNTHTASTRALLAHIHRRRGDLALAESEIREALDVNRAIHRGDHSDVAQMLSQLAGALRAKGDFLGALEYNTSAAEMMHRLYGVGNPRTIGYARALASSQMELGDYTAAEGTLRTVHRRYVELTGDRNLTVAAAGRDLGRCLSRVGRLAEAEDTLSSAVDIEREMLSPDHPRLLVTLTHLAHVRFERGEYADAEGLLAESARIYEASRLRIGSGMERAAYAEMSPYAWLALSQLEQGRPGDAWDSVERSTGRALVDLLAEAERRDRTPAERAEEDSLRALVFGLEERLAAYQDAARVDSTALSEEDVEAARAELATAEIAWSRFRREMVRRHPESEGNVASLDEVQRGLGASTALVGWLDVERLDGRTDSWAYVVRDRGPVTWARLETDGDGAPGPGGAGSAVRSELSDPSSPLLGVRRELLGLWRERFAPVAGALEGVREIVVVPSGPLLGVPVEAIPGDDGRMLGDVFDISYAPSATIYARLGGSELARGGESRGLLIGDPPFAEGHLAQMREDPDSVWELLAAADDASGNDAALLRSAASGNKDALTSLSRLRGTRAEVMLLEETVGSATVLLGERASEQEIIRMAEAGELVGHSALHIATHALVDDAHPEQSALVLSQVGLPDALEAAASGERIYDGLLTAKEIVSELDLDAELVTLSACETGLGAERVGEGYVGFAQALMQAGARSIVVSLWKVDDRATALLMRRFYENLDLRRRGEPGGPATGKAEALREAKQWLRDYTDDSGKRPYEHPYYWSAFILIGDRS